MGINVMRQSALVEYSGKRNTKKCGSQTVISQMKGKKRNVSKGHSSGFIPSDYTEITTSEDSCATKRRRMNSNANDNDCFGVPVQVYSVSKMSQSELTNLEQTLECELEQVRAILKKITKISSNGVDVSPTSYIHSFSDGKRKQVPAKSLQRPVGKSASQRNKRDPLVRNGHQTKTGVAAGRSVSVKQEQGLPPTGRSISVKQEQGLPSNASDVLLMKQCETLLGRLMQQRCARMFNIPVDVVKWEIPDYYDVIKHPMDLGTVKSKLISGQYSNPSSFAADVRLTFSNAMTYNSKGHYVHSMAETLSKYFEIRWKQIEKKLHATKSELACPKSSVSFDTEIPNPMPQPKRSRSSTSTGAAKSMPQPEKSKSSVYVGAETGKAKPKLWPENSIKQVLSNPVMTAVEKNRLKSELEDLLADLPENIIEFLKENSSTEIGEDEDEYDIVFDIESLSDDTLFKLRMLLDDYMVKRNRSLAKTEPRVVELQNESGLSNSSVQPCRGNDPVEEEIDIGGNDIYTSSFPLVQIEKDTALKNTRCCSTSNSSDDSASSSSGDSASSSSDSDASSDSDTVGAKTPVPMDTTKEIVGSVTNVEQKKTNFVNKLNTGKHSPIKLLDQREQDSESQPVCVEADVESAPPERHASPDKLYRAALLRSRFADTILKAQEKTTLGKDNKQDPEKSRLKKEELQRRRKEEKARLQAEAKAAEEARKKAEAEVAAEAKRKIELEREAARQALQKMEKTVDINENCHFKEDLEMLGVGPESRVHSFKFQGNSNLLEQLGLYRKDYSDEEEEGNPKRPIEVDDPEEGEID